MKLSLAAIAAALVLTSCAVGVRGPASDIGDTSVVMNGEVFSSTGGPGSWFIRYGTSDPLAEQTPARSVEFDAGELRSVSEQVEGLDPATTYRYQVCAEDGENPGDPFCSPTQLFRTTAPGGVFRVVSTCTDQYPYGVSGEVESYEPDTTFGVRATFETGGTAGTLFTTDADGSSGVGSVLGTEPFTAHVVIWLNPNADFEQDPGEPTVHDQVWVVDEPCTDGHPLGGSNS
jgi:hypothetical protein